MKTGAELPAPGQEAEAPGIQPEELAMAARILSGDGAAFVSLVEALHPTLLRLARGFVPSHAVAEEVVQETWLAVLEGLAAFEGRARLRTWITRILVNRAKTRGVREGRSVPLSTLGDDGDAAPAAVDPARFTARGGWSLPPRRWSDDTPEKKLLGAESRTVIDRAIEALPPGQRAVIALRDVSGYSAEEVCEALDISEANQRVLLHRGRSSVRAALERYLDGR